MCFLTEAVVCRPKGVFGSDDAVYDKSGTSIDKGVDNASHQDLGYDEAHYNRKGYVQSYFPVVGQENGRGDGHKHQHGYQPVHDVPCELGWGACCPESGVYVEQYVAENPHETKQGETPQLHIYRGMHG